MSNGGNAIVGIAARSTSIRRQRSEIQSGQSQRTTRSPNRWLIRLVTAGIFLPYTIGTTGKYVIAIVFVPAVLTFFGRVFRGTRRFYAADFFMLATTAWMIATKAGTPELQPTASDALALLGSYMVARSFYFGESSLEEFIRVIRVIAIVLVGLSVLDTLSDQFFVNQLVARIFQVPILPFRADVHRTLLGFYIIRATSTFPHPILFGTFCAIAGTIFLYSEQSHARRLFYCGICLFGCVMSVSSGPLLGYTIGFLVFCYDRAFKRISLRWLALWATLAAFICALNLFSNRPTGWLIEHFTLTPETGYWRLMVWLDAFNYIDDSPFLGNSPSAWMRDDILSNSVDSVWLVLALVYGLPVVFFLLLASVLACTNFRGNAEAYIKNLFMQRMRTAFSVALAVFVFIGLAVHFWDAVWMFWALCIGIRVSIGEYFLLAKKRQPG